MLLALSALWWAVVLLMRAQGMAWTPALPPAAVHGLLMTLGFMPLFITGFLFTAGTRWLGMPGVEARTLLPAVAAQVVGWLLVLVGSATLAWLAALGLALVASGWSRLALRFVGLLRRSPVDDRTHPGVIAVAGVVAALALWAAAAAVALDAVAWLRPLTLWCVYGFIGVVFVTVAHRMIPFFTAAALPVLDAWRPMWLLWVFLALMALQAGVALAEALWWPLPSAVLVVVAVCEAAGALAVLGLALRWGLVQSLKARLLAMLHLGFVWLGIALALSAVSHALQAATAGASSLGLAPLHAFTMGFLGSTLIAMATRVSCGHSGRALVADDFVWRLFGVLQLAVLARVVAALMPASVALELSVLLWAGVCVAWGVRYGRWWGRPRIDGRPG